MGNNGKLEEDKVKTYVKSILNMSKYKFEDSDGRGPKIENMYDFMIKKGHKKFYFEIYSPAQDQKIIMDKLNTSNGAIISLEYLESSILKKYIIQFKDNPPKFLIINLNECKMANSFKVLSSTPLEQMISTKIFPSEEYIGLFHKKNYIYSKGDTILEYEAHKKSIKLNNMKKMAGIIIFIDNKFCQIIINPYSKTYSIDEITKLLDISNSRRSIINNKPVNEGIKIVKKDIYHLLAKL